MYISNPSTTWGTAIEGATLGRNSGHRVRNFPTKRSPFLRCYSEDCEDYSILGSILGLPCTEAPQE